MGYLYLAILGISALVLMVLFIISKLKNNTITNEHYKFCLMATAFVIMIFALDNTLNKQHADSISRTIVVIFAVSSFVWGYIGHLKKKKSVELGDTINRIKFHISKRDVEDIKNISESDVWFFVDTAVTEQIKKEQCSNDYGISKEEIKRLENEYNDYVIEKYNKALHSDIFSSVNNYDDDTVILLSTNILTLKFQNNFFESEEEFNALDKFQSLYRKREALVKEATTIVSGINNETAIYFKIPLMEKFLDIYDKLSLVSKEIENYTPPQEIQNILERIKSSETTE